jgi:hypothetical protein
MTTVEQARSEIDFSPLNRTRFALVLNIINSLGALGARQIFHNLLERDIDVSKPRFAFKEHCLFVPKDKGDLIPVLLYSTAFLLVSTDFLPAQNKSERYNVGSWEMIIDSGFCLAKLSTWSHEVWIGSMDGKPFIDLYFNFISMTSRETWGYTGEEGKQYQAFNDNGVSYVSRFSDYWDEEKLSLVASDGYMEPSWGDAYNFMRVISTGTQISISTDVWTEAATENQVVMSFSHEGGYAAMDLVAKCR